MSTFKRNLLELELDDWIDPSLPRMYSEWELPSEEIFTIGDDFTNENEEFRNTPLLPSFTPVWGRNGLELRK